MNHTLDVRIQGDSMWPSFRDGDTLAFTKEGLASLAVKDVVLVSHPLKPEVRMVKRVLRIEENGDLFLVGDNPDPLASEDSHNFGPVPRRLVEARWLGESWRA
ncbi:MAG: S26 family signal peptidase [Candidatus Poseidoniales archaeon]|jgi:nickel-type superoxide dismutase maturation protease